MTDQNSTPTTKRFIAMRDFATVDAKADAMKGKKTVLAQVVGQVVAVKEVKGTVTEKNGEVKETISLKAIGDFQVVNYSSGEVSDANAIFLPGYYAEAIQASLSTGASAIDFAVEIVMEPTGKAIPFTYAIRQLVARPTESGVERMKRQLAAKGILRLPAPLEPAPLQLQGNATIDAVEEPSDGAPAEGAETEEVVDHGKRGRKAA